METLRNLVSIRSLKAPPSGTSAEMLVCSEESFVAADSLRNALLDLQAAYALLAQLRDLAKSQSATTSKDI